MNATLNLVDHLLAMGRKYQELGRHRDALNLFTRLAGFRETMNGIAAERKAPQPIEIERGGDGEILHVRRGHEVFVRVLLDDNLASREGYYFDTDASVPCCGVE